MSQLNVDTLGGQTGTTISIASGHTLSGVGGLDGAQQFRLTATITTTGFNDITSNLEVPDTENQGNLGSLVTNSSGIFSFSETLSPSEAFFSSI